MRDARGSADRCPCGANCENGTLKIMVELPVEEGELIVNAIERAVEAGEGRDWRRAR